MIKNSWDLKGPLTSSKILEKSYEPFLIKIVIWHFETLTE